MSRARDLADGTFSGAFAADSPTFVVDAANNRVGIGTSAPNAKLAFGESGSVAFNTSLGGTGTYAEIKSFNALAPTNPATNIRFIRDVAVFGNDGAVCFDTTNAERLRITSSGNVGIGTSSPSNFGGANLQVQNSTIASVLWTDGTHTGQLLASASAEVSLGSRSNHPLRFGTNDTERMRLDASGSLLVGTTTPTSSKVRIFRDSPTNYNNANLELESQTGNVVLGFHAAGTSAVQLRHERGVGSIQARDQNDTGFASMQASAFTVSSDYRMKENVVPLVGATERVKQLPVYRFNFKPFEETGEDWGDKTVDGFLAHEAAAVVPEAVIGEKDGLKEDGSPLYQSIDQSKLVPLLTAALQEALADIATLKAEVAALKGSA